MTDPVRRLGLIGDIHCEDVRLAAALEHLERSGAQLVCATGDIVDGAGDPNRCCALLAEHDVATVAGNHERWLLAGVMRELPDATALTDLDRSSRRFVEALPRTRTIPTVAGDALLCHGLGENDMVGVRPDDYGYALETNESLTRLIAVGERLVLNGHTHRPMLRNVDGLCIANAGTLARDWDPGFWLLDLDRRRGSWFSVDAAGRIEANSPVPLPLRHETPGGWPKTVH